MRLEPRYLITLLLALIVGVGITFRMSAIGDKFYWVDEVWSSLMIAGTDIESINGALRRRAGETLDVGFVRSLIFPSPSSTPLDTVRSLWVQDPHHGPLYFVLARLWTAVGGAEPASIRLFTTLIGLMIFPALWLLLGELYPPSMSRWPALALFAASPFFLIYTQQAREYGLWVLMLLLLNKSFMLALRRPSTTRWLLFSAILAAAVYTNLLSIPVWVGFAAWVLMRRNESSRKEFALASAAALVAAAPWLVNAFMRRQVIFDSIASLDKPASARLYSGTFLLNVSRLFLDWGWETALAVPCLDWTFIACALFTGAASVWALWRARSRMDPPFKLWLCCFGLPVLVGMLIMDAVLGGQRALIARYLMPVWVALLMAIAAGLSGAVEHQARRGRVVDRMALALLLGMGLASSIKYLRSPYWWTSHPADMARAALAVKNDPVKDPLVMVIGSNPVYLISMAHTIDSATPFLAFEREEEIESKLEGSDFTIYSPSRSLRLKLSKTHELTALKGLWRAKSRLRAQH